MRRRCKHENVTGWMWRETGKHLRDIGITHQWAHAFVQPGRADHHHRVTCDDCHAWLPLGPSRDTPATEIEVRAAAIAAVHVGAPFVKGGIGFNVSCMPYAEWCGFEHAGYADIGGAITDRVMRDYDAGYLARCIVEHTEGES